MQKQDRTHLVRAHAAGRPVFPGDQSRWFHLFQRSGRSRPDDGQAGGRRYCGRDGARLPESLGGSQGGLQGFHDVVRAGIYLASMGDYVAVNGIYARHFSQPFPARTAIGVAAQPLGACVEIDLVVKA